MIMTLAFSRCSTLGVLSARWTVRTFAVWLVWVAACSSDNSPKYPDTNSFCNARGQAECSTEVIMHCAAPNATRCISQRQAACVTAVPVGTSYNPNGAEACLRAVGAAYGDAVISTLENRDMADACATVFDGPGAANSTCQKNIDCKASAGLRCVPAGGSSSGTCQIPQRVQGGGSCNSPSQLCIDGFHCGFTQHCDINSQVGELCNDTLPCDEAARCTASGRCEKKFDDGTACTSAGECLHDICLRGAMAAQGICASQITIAPNEPFCIDAR
jgi:hypothetical protein